MSDICDLTVVEAARDYRAGRFSAVEMVRAYRKRNEVRHARLNAMVVPLWDHALVAAETLDTARARGDVLGPLSGAGLTIKESYAVAGTPATMGLRALAQEISATDAPLVAALRAAGGIILGKSNVSQLMMYHESDNALYGRTNHPEDPTRSPGGSTGGEAALIAARCSTAGLASDLGGSIRQPAASCGIMGLKPTSGRLSTVGMRKNFRGLRALEAVPGPLARTTADLDLLMKTWIDAGTPADEIVPAPWPDFRDITVRGMRIVWWDDDGEFAPAPGIRRAIRRAAQALSDAGAELIEWKPPAMSEVIRMYFALLSADGGADLKALLGGERADDRVDRLLLLAGLPKPLRWLARIWETEFRSPRVGRLLKDCGLRSTDAFWKLNLELDAYRRRFAAELRALNATAMLGPAHPLPALTHGSTDWLALAGGSCYLANLLDYPAGVVPIDRIRPAEESDRPQSSDRVDRTARSVEQGSAGLPIGVQIYAPRWREDVVLAVMSILEAALPMPARTENPRQ